MTTQRRRDNQFLLAMGAMMLLLAGTIMWLVWTAQAIQEKDVIEMTWEVARKFYRL